MEFPSKKRKLKDVTLVIIDTLKPELCLKLLKYNSKFFDFGNIKLFTNKKPESDLNGIDFVKIKTLNQVDKLQKPGSNDYSEFCINELHKYIDTKFCLIIQRDGFISNYKNWDDEFLKYDYIGAPWPPYHLKRCKWIQDKKNLNLVGNGGFSLRSKHILQLAAKCPAPEIGPEDAYFCNNNKQYFLNNGAKHAPPSITLKFSRDNPTILSDTFGFHGNKNYINYVLKGIQ